jgi:hypothetical protein
MDDPDIRRILLSGRARKIRAGIRAPVAEKSDDPRFELGHLLPPLTLKIAWGMGQRAKGSENHSLTNLLYALCSLRYAFCSY